MIRPKGRMIFVASHLQYTLFVILELSDNITFQVASGNPNPLPLFSITPCFHHYYPRLGADLSVTLNFNLSSRLRSMYLMTLLFFMTINFSVFKLRNLNFSNVFKKKKKKKNKVSLNSNQHK